MGSPVRFRRGAPPRNHRSGRVQYSACLHALRAPNRTAICQRFGIKRCGWLLQYDAWHHARLGFYDLLSGADDNRQSSLNRRDHLGGHVQGGVRAVVGAQVRTLGRVLLRWQAPQPASSDLAATVAEAVDPYASPYAGHPRAPSSVGSTVVAVYGSRGLVDRKTMAD
jgi:hypothetical protein